VRRREFEGKKNETHWGFSFPCHTFAEKAKSDSISGVAAKSETNVPKEMLSKWRRETVTPRTALRRATDVTGATAVRRLTAGIGGGRKKRQRNMHLGRWMKTHIAG